MKAILSSICPVILCSVGFAQQWQTLTPLPDGYQEHQLVYANGFLYNIGGVSDTNGALDGMNVFFSQVYSNGTIGTWNRTTSLPENIFDAAAVADSGHVYVLGGNRYTDDAGEWTTNTVYFSKVNSDGTLADWLVAPSLPQSIFWFGAAVWNHTIYITGGVDQAGDVMNSAWSAKIQAGGGLSTWTAQAPLPYAVYAQCEVANGDLYLLGGNIENGNIVTRDVYISEIDPQGNLTGWIQTMTLPQGFSNFAAVAGAGRVFVIDGWNGLELVNAFNSAAAAGDGSLSSWTIGSSLPQSLIFNAATAGGNYIFESGGANAQNPSPAVYSTPFPSPPVAPELTSLVTNQTFRLQLASSTNTGFAIQTSTNLTNWINIGWGFTDTNGLLLFQDTNAAQFSNRFYRAYWPLP